MLQTQAIDNRRELLAFRRAMYHALPGKTIDGRTAAEWSLVNEALPHEQLEARVTAVVKTLLQKKPIALKATEDAIRRVGEMPYDSTEHYRARPGSGEFLRQREPQGGDPSVHRREVLQGRPRCP